MSEQERIQYEEAPEIEEYFGILGLSDGPEINSDFGHLVNLLTIFKEKHIPAESYKIQYSHVDGTIYKT